MRAESLMRTPVVACLVAVLSVGCMSRPTYSSAVQGSEIPGAIPTTPRLLSTGITTDFASIVQQNGPAVVNISAARSSHVANLAPLWPPASNEHDPFVQFFRQFSPGRSSDDILPSETSALASSSARMDTFSLAPRWLQARRKSTSG